MTPSTPAPAGVAPLRCTMTSRSSPFTTWRFFPREVVMVLDVEDHVRAELLRDVLVDERVVRGGVTVIKCSWPAAPSSDYASSSFTTCARLDAGQPLVEALELEREPLVVDAQAVQDRGVQVVDVDRVLDDVVAEVVGLAVDDARP